MDVYYMSDSIQYGSFRNPLYRDYEKFPYGTLENTLNSPPKSSGGVQKQHSRNQNQAVAGQGKSGKGKSSKDSCPFCKEQKKRPLGAYMRKRGQRITHESISEDAEECAEGQEEEEEDEGTESQDDICTSSSPSGSPSAAELANNDGHHHNHDHRRHGASRQESQDSGCEAKWDDFLICFFLL